MRTGKRHHRLPRITIKRNGLTAGVVRARLYTKVATAKPDKIAKTDATI